MVAVRLFSAGHPWSVSGRPMATCLTRCGRRMDRRSNKDGIFLRMRRFETMESQRMGKDNIAGRIRSMRPAAPGPSRCVSALAAWLGCFLVVIFLQDDCSRDQGAVFVDKVCNWRTLGHWTFTSFSLCVYSVAKDSRAAMSLSRAQRESTYA